MNADRSMAIVIVVATVYALASLLFWQGVVFPIIFIIVAMLTWFLRRLAARQRQRDEKFEQWRTSPETRAQFLREMGYRGGDSWEGVQSNGPDEPKS